MQELLRKILIFSRLDSDRLREILPFLKQKEYQAGEILFRENAQGDKLFLIVEGEIEISKLDTNGQGRLILAVRKKGDVIGEMSVLSEEPRFADARALTRTKVIELSELDFQRMLYEHPQIAYQIMRVLTSRIRQADLHMMDELKQTRDQLGEAYQSIEAVARTLRKTKQES